MSNLAFGPAPVVTQRLGGSAEQGVAITSGAGAWGAWTTLSASFTHPVDSIVVSARTDVSVGLPFYLSLAVGAGADANMVVDGLFVPTPVSPGWEDTWSWHIPIRVPAGQTLFAKTAATSAVAQRVMVRGASAGAGRQTGFSRLQALTLNLSTIQPPQFTAVSGGGTTWVEYVASTARRYVGLWPVLDVTPSVINRRFALRVGMGSAPSETQIVSEVFGSKNVSYVFGSSGIVPVHVPASSRLAIALNSDTASEPARVHLMGLYV